MSAYGLRPSAAPLATWVPVAVGFGGPLANSRGLVRPPTQNKENQDRGDGHRHVGSDTYCAVDTRSSQLAGQPATSSGRRALDIRQLHGRDPLRARTQLSTSPAPRPRQGSLTLEPFAGGRDVVVPALHSTRFDKHGTTAIDQLQAAEPATNAGSSLDGALPELDRTPGDHGDH